MKKVISFELPVLITQQDKRFVAYAPAFDISTCGKTRKEASKRFKELASLFLEEIVKAKTIREVK